ncbi:hypothetical protein LRC537489_44530 [Mycobacterium riyadhense]|uniref:Uncharacterized protein n=1 Tax=Mycobacterium riyadhense TaxID=486698 RepID=A0A653F4I2_9MYCO|nr:hypothetical protein BIN_B_05589 [Mycobacterium riyadhense]
MVAVPKIPAPRWRYPAIHKDSALCGTPFAAVASDTPEIGPKGRIGDELPRVASGNQLGATE